MKYYEFKENKSQGTPDFPIEFYHVDEKDPRYQMPYHWHPHIEIIRILEGRFNLILNGVNYELTRGDIVYIEDGMSHGGTPIDCVYECIVFDLKLLLKSDFITNTFIKRVLRHEVSIAPNAINSIKYKFNIFDFLFEAMYRKVNGYEFDVIGSLYILYGCIYRNNLYKSTPNAKKSAEINSAKFKKAIDYIETHYADNITLNDMADAVGMSPKYFCRYFKNMSGKTPIGYLNYYRIERACEQMSTYDISVTEVAFSNGFNDISYFIKIFKEQKGVTPKQFMLNTQ